VPSTPKITSRPKPMAGLPLHDGSGSGGCDSGELSDWGYLADLVIDGVDSLVAALVGGLIAGALIGAAE
jgi:hypothetical protein